MPIQIEVVIGESKGGRLIDMRIMVVGKIGIKDIVEVIMIVETMEIQTIEEMETKITGEEMTTVDSRFHQVTHRMARGTEIVDLETIVTLTGMRAKEEIVVSKMKVIGREATVDPTQAAESNQRQNTLKTTNKINKLAVNTTRVTKETICKCLILKCLWAIKLVHLWYKW
jgi:hypothetical protein